METSTAGGNPIISEEQALIEQRRLEALLEITSSHNKEVQGLKSQLEAAEKKVMKFSVQAKNLDGEIKTLRAQNPDRMKKQVKRLQEQNRVFDHREQYAEEQAKTAAAAGAEPDA